MTIGVLGGGQLGRMLALAAYPLGVSVRFLDPSPDAPAGQVGPLVPATFDDARVLDRFADGLTVATYEFENAPVAAARRIAARVPVRPDPCALEAAQDRLPEKQLFERLGIPTAKYMAITRHDELPAALEQTGLPAILKTRRLGYDGKGQYVLESQHDAERAWEVLAGGSYIVESMVKFDRELSILAVRNVRGQTVFYPLIENHHRDGILRVSLAPALNLGDKLVQLAQDYATRMLDALKYVGVLAIEFFQCGDALVANEFAPRVHNSGHWTIEGAVTSQFENHVRAILDMPLGCTEARGHSAMVNAIGVKPDAARVLAIAGAHLHDYGKTPRPGRKVGHVTVCRDAPGERDEAMKQICAAMGIGCPNRSALSFAV